MFLQNNAYIMYSSPHQKKPQIIASAGQTALISLGHLGNALSQSYSPLNQASPEPRMPLTCFLVDQNYEMAFVKTPAASHHQELLTPTFPTPHFCNVFHLCKT